MQPSRAILATALLTVAVVTTPTTALPDDGVPVGDLIWPPPPDHFDGAGAWKATHGIAAAAAAGLP